MNYIIYCRKSTDSEDRQILSLDSQEHELLAIAERHNLKITKVFKESMSAKSAGRPIFNQMMKLICSGKADAILCWKLDRLARNFIDGGLVMDSLQKGVIKEIRTYESVHLPNETSFILAMQFGMANQYSRDLSINVKRGNREKLARGEWPNHAPYGYVNDKVTKTILLDFKSAHYFRRAFELYATGKYHLRQVAEILYNDGLRTYSGKKVGPGYIHKILKNPFYYGMMLREGKLYEGKHPPIITKTLFDQVQNVMSGKFHSKEQKHFFHLRGLLKCADCGCMFTASKKKGHDYYYCTNGKKTCEAHKEYLRSEKLDHLVAEVFGKLEMDEELFDLAYDAAKERSNREGAYVSKNAEIIEKRLSEVREAQSRLCDSFTAGNTPESLYNAKITALANEEKALMKQLKDLPKQPEVTLEPIKNIFLRAIAAKKDYMNAEPAKKRIVAQELLWNLSLQNQKVLSYQFKPTFAIIAKGPKPDSLRTMLGLWDEVGILVMRLSLEPFKNAA